MKNRVMRQDGLPKLLEELGELGQIAAKLAIIHPETVYYDGRDLIINLQQEMGDVLATMEYVAARMGLSEHVIKKRAEEKLKQYKSWEGK